MALRSRGFNTQKIAIVCRVAPETITRIEGDPGWMPSHDLAAGLLEMYRRHVRME